MAYAASKDKPSAFKYEPAAFKKLYPEQFYKQHIENGLRPDGRTFGRARPTTIGLDATATADSSALVKIGSTTVLAGIKLEVLVSTEPLKEGDVVTSIEMTPLCSGTPLDRRRTSDLAQTCTEQVTLLLKNSRALNLSKLVFGGGRACWIIYLDIYVLDADGSILDACLLGAVTAISGLKSLPQVAIDEAGTVQPNLPSGKDISNPDLRLVDRQLLPVCLTCGLHEGKISADLTAEEEQLMQCTITAAIDSADRIIGIFQPGGKNGTSTGQISDCIELTKLRYKEIIELLDQSLDQGDETAIQEE